MEFTLDELYKLRTDSGVLTHALYEKLGGVEGALATCADDVFGALSGPVRAVLPRVLRLLVGIGGGEGESSIRRIAPLERLRGTPEMAALTDALVAARLLTTDQDEQGHSVVRVTHEALLSRWRPVAEWLDRDRELLRYQFRVSAAASRWDREGQPSDLLLPEGKPLEEGATLLRSWGDELNATEHEFIARSRRRAQRARRLKRGAVVALSFLTLLAVGLAVAAIREAGAANRAADAANRARKSESVALEQAKDEQKKAILARDVARRNAYVAHMNLAQRDWNDTHVGRVLDLLEGERPREGETDLRSFEWFYFNRLCHWDLLTLKGHTSGVNGVTFSLDGRRIASASSDSTVKVWEASSGKEMLTLAGHFQAVNRVTFSPDGRRIASASDDQHVKVWDAGSGQETLMLIGHTDAVTGVAFSPDGRRIASASWDHTVKVWDAGSGQVTLTLKGHDFRVHDVAFSPDGRRIASAGWDHTVKVWDAGSGQESLTLKGHTNEVSDVAFSPDGRRIASASGDLTVKVWDAGSGQETLALKGHTGWVHERGVQPRRPPHRLGQRRPDSRRSGTPTPARRRSRSRDTPTPSEAWRSAPTADASPRPAADKTVKVWDAGTGQETLTLKGHTTWVIGVAFSPDGRRIASAGSGQTVKVWDADTAQETAHAQGTHRWRQ